MATQQEDKFGSLMWSLVAYYCDKAMEKYMEDAKLLSDYWRKPNMPTPEELMSARGPIYGEARINLACTQELCDVFDKYVGKSVVVDLSSKHTAEEVLAINAAHKAAIHLVLTKIARIASGAFHEDNYDDGATYLIIAKKIMKGESTLPEVPRRNARPIDVDKVFGKEI